MSKIMYSHDPQKFVSALALELKKIPEFQAPEFISFVKSGVAKQRVPENPDFWYIRSAAILRQLYIQGVVGVSRLRTRFGSRKNRGMQPARFRRAGGKIIRTILQQSEKAGLVEKVTKNQFGRRLTLKGRQLLDSIKTGESN